MVLFIFSYQLWPYLQTKLFPGQIHTVLQGLTCPVGSHLSSCLLLSTHPGPSFGFLLRFWVWSQNRNNAYPILVCSLTTVAGASMSEPPLLVCSCPTNLHLSDSETPERARERSWSCVYWNAGLCPLWCRQRRNEIDGEGTWLART